MLGGELGDKINAILSAVGFNLVKLMKGLKKRWLKRLFLCLQSATDDFVVGIVRFARMVELVLNRPAVPWHPSLGLLG